MPTGTGIGGCTFIVANTVRALCGGEGWHVYSRTAGAGNNPRPQSNDKRMSVNAANTPTLRTRGGERVMGKHSAALTRRSPKTQAAGGGGLLVWPRESLQFKGPLEDMAPAARGAVRPAGGAAAGRVAFGVGPAVG